MRCGGEHGGDVVFALEVVGVLVAARVKNPTSALLAFTTSAFTTSAFLAFHRAVSRPAYAHTTTCCYPKWPERHSNGDSGNSGGGDGNGNSGNSGGSDGNGNSGNSGGSNGSNGSGNCNSGNSGNSGSSDGNGNSGNSGSSSDGTLGVGWQ
jgi:hypothetical protein